MTSSKSMQIRNMNGRGTMLETFDVVEWLRDKRISYTQQGKNVSGRDVVGVQCPFCNDKSNHLGIFLTTKMLSCWKCGPHGPITNYIREIEGCSYAQAERILQMYQDRSLPVLRQDIRQRANDLTYPPEAVDEIPDLHRAYLAHRRFDPEFLRAKYKLKFCNELGQYKFRVIVPVIVDGVMVNFSAMDVVRDDSNKGRSKYVHCKNELAITPMKRCLYNIDSVRRHALVVEGVTDVWRVGDGAVAVMGIQFTADQLHLLAKKELLKVTILFDPEPQAQRRAELFATNLATVVKNVSILQSDSGVDPADMADEEISQIRKIFLDMD